MDKLLTAVLDAHGGLRNWTKVTRISAEMSLGGPFWAARGWPAFNYPHFRGNAAALAWPAPSVIPWVPPHHSWEVSHGLGSVSALR
jgi:hypothetical protein